MAINISPIRLPTCFACGREHAADEQCLAKVQPPCQYCGLYHTKVEPCLAQHGSSDEAVANMAHRLVQLDSVRRTQCAMLDDLGGDLKQAQAGYAAVQEQLRQAGREVAALRRELDAKRAEPAVDYTAMEGGEVNRACGDDARLWAKAFRQYVEKHIGVPLDEAWLVAWFANAIETACDVRRERSAQEPETWDHTQDPCGPAATNLPECRAQVRELQRIVLLMQQDLKAAHGERGRLANLARDLCAHVASYT